MSDELDDHKRTNNRKAQILRDGYSRYQLADGKTVELFFGSMVVSGVIEPSSVAHTDVDFAIPGGEPPRYSLDPAIVAVVREHEEFKAKTESIKALIERADRLLESSEPLRPSSIILEFALPFKLSRDFIANMEEVHDDIWVPRYGASKARWLWHTQSLRQIVGHWMNAAIDLLTRARKIIY